MVITLPRTGQRNVGSAPVASLALTGVSADTSAGAVVADASWTLCWGSPDAAAILVAGGANAVAGCMLAAGCATGATAAVFAPGTVSFMPSLSFACGSRLLALASSATGT